jgi:hypothetical protein
MFGGHGITTVAPTDVGKRRSKGTKISETRRNPDILVSRHIRFRTWGQVLLIGRLKRDKPEG